MMSFTTTMSKYKLNDNMAGNKTSHHDQVITSVSFNRTKTMVNTSAMPICSPPLYVCLLCNNYIPQYREMIKINHPTRGSTMYPLVCTFKKRCAAQSKLAFPAKYNLKEDDFLTDGTLATTLERGFLFIMICHLYNHYPSSKK